MSRRKDIKISLLGDQNVGKTCICSCFLKLEFIDNTLNTIGKDKMEAKMKMKDGKEIKLIIWDTAGQERYHSIAVNTIKSAQGIIVAFDLTSRKSFENVEKWLNQIYEKTNKVSVVIFGNKCDMKNERKVSTEEAQKLADQYKLTYFETSAKKKININEGFEKVANDAYNNYGNKVGMDLEEEKEEFESGCCGKKKVKKKKKKNEKK